MCSVAGQGWWWEGGEEGRRPQWWGWWLHTDALCYSVCVCTLTEGPSPWQQLTSEAKGAVTALCLLLIWCYFGSKQVNLILDMDTAAKGLLNLVISIAFLHSSPCVSSSSFWSHIHTYTVYRPGVYLTSYPVQWVAWVWDSELNNRWEEES